MARNFNIKYIKTDLVFDFTRPRQNEYRPPGLPAIRMGAVERLTGRAGGKPNLGCLSDMSFRRAVIPGQKTPRTLLAQFYLGFYPKTIMR
jgi:hypothetical protein